MTSAPGRGGSRALLTDLYELTMAEGYLAAGRADDEAVFHLFFRTLPFGGGYARAHGFEVTLIEDGCRAVELTAGDGARAIDDMRRAGVRIANSADVG